jgi:hypothetical protein
MGAMATDLIELVVGWTGAMDWQLLADDAPADLTGATPLLVVHDTTGALVTLAGTPSLVTAATGIVRYLPAAGDFAVALSPYAYRWKVTDAAGKVTYFPSGAAGVLRARA